MVGIWYIKLETLLFTSYVTSLEICKKPGWNPNIAHKHYLKVVIISYSSINIVAILALGLRPRHGLAKVCAKREAWESHLMLSKV
jgi:hypothetical protein